MVSGSVGSKTDFELKVAISWVKSWCPPLPNSSLVTSVVEKVTCPCFAGYITCKGLMSMWRRKRKVRQGKCYSNDSSPLITALTQKIIKIDYITSKYTRLTCLSISL